ncbi:MAG TPA: nucleotidyltransferase domain-containing protein [Azospirillum sp.]|nr:nucleotidyltransferase domain-containing protein [Azospirillum sp.]
MALALTEDQKEAIWFVLRRNFGPDAQVWVFGSRARGDDQGDIDLYVEVPDETDDILINKARSREQLEILLYRKVDIIVRRVNSEKTAFDRKAKRLGVPLAA